MSVSLRQKIGKYELHTCLGRGGSAEVWKAFDPDLRRFVAIKVLHPTQPNDTEFRQRFVREARVIAQLHHPHIVQVHEFSTGAASARDADEQEGDFAYMVMRYVEGMTLAEYIQRASRIGQCPSASLVWLFASLGSALDYAHAKGVIHRDVKPANILLDRGNTTLHPMGAPVLTDFGMVKVQGGNATDTAGDSGMVVGTPRYSSPEQAQGNYSEVTGLSDIYSLGIILYELCTGIHPYAEMKRQISGQHRRSSFTQHVFAQQPPFPSTVNPALSLALSHVILRSIANDPTFRYPTASALAQALASALNVPLPEQMGLQVSVDSSTPPAPTPEVNAPGAGSAHVAAPPQGLRNNPARSHRDDIAASHGHGQAKPRTRRVRQRLLTCITALILLVVVVLSFILSAGVGSPALSQEASGSTMVGSVSFLSSGQTSLTSNQGQSDEVEISLQHLAQPAQGKSYYAWLESDDSVSDTQAVLLGTLTVSSGGVALLTYSGDAPHSNLLAAFSQFLITEQDAAVTPLVPSLDTATWRYYGAIAHIPNPRDTTNHFSLLDHLRHLLASDPELRAVRLSGGLDGWLYRNSLQVRDLAASARAAWDAQNTIHLHRQVIRILDYLDGSAFVWRDVPPATPLLVDARLARVGLLEFDPESSAPLGYISHIAFHLTGLDNSPGRTARQHTLALHVLDVLNLVKQELEQARLDARKLAQLSGDQLLRAPAVPVLNDLVTQTNLAFTGRSTPATTTGSGGVSLILTQLQALAIIEVVPSTRHSPVTDGSP